MVRGEESTGNDSPPVKGAIWVKPHESAGHHVRGYWRGPNGEQIKTWEQAASSASLMPLRKTLRKTLGGKTGSKPDLDKINEFSAASEAYTAEHASELYDRLMDQLDLEDNGEIIPEDEVVIIAPYRMDLSRSILIAGNDPVSMKYYNALKNASTDEELSLAIKHGSMLHDGIIDSSGTASASIAFWSMVKNGHADKIGRDNALKITQLTSTMRTESGYDADIIALRPDLFRDDDLKTIMRNNLHDNYASSYAYSAYREYSSRHSNDDSIVEGITDGSIASSLAYKAEHIPRLIREEKAGVIDPGTLNAILKRNDRLGLNLNDLNSASPRIDDHISFIRQVKDDPRYQETSTLMAGDALRVLDRKSDEVEGDHARDNRPDAEDWNVEEQVNEMRSSLILTYGSGGDPDPVIMTHLFSRGSFKSSPDEQYEDDGWDEGAYVDQGPIASDSDYKALALGCRKGWLSGDRITELAWNEGFTSFFMKSSCWKHMDASTRKAVMEASKKQNQYSKY